MMACSYPGSN